MPKNAKKLICIFCLFVRAEMTSRHKNSSKTLQNTPKMVQNSINGLNIYIGSPSKKKNRKILTQGKSCFFTVNATKIYIYHELCHLNVLSQNIHGLDNETSENQKQRTQFLDLAVAKSLQSTRTVTDVADAADVLTTTGYTC